MLLVGDIALHVERERIAVGQHAAQREEGAGHPSRGSPSRRPSRSEPSERKAGVLDAGGNSAQHNGDPRQCTNILCG
jgi:hypothetical protein